ncbi:MAG TPA: HAD family phosphatase [Acidimicrobiia bacterium]|nr:HAD family phosphatase [Acidimicrobiia bacterium]
MNRPGAVVFDCDGVLVDSEPHSVAAWMIVLGRLRHPGTAGDVERCTGLGFLPTREALAVVATLPDPDELWPMLLDALAESFRMGLHRFSDAIDTLEACERAGVPLGVASAGPRSRLDLTLQVAGLADRFAASVAGDEVSRGKPAPDVYLRAAGLLGVEPRHCVAVEDSPVGAQAARAAGMRTIGVVRRPGDRTALEVAGAVVVQAVTPDMLGLIPGV